MHESLGTVRGITRPASMMALALWGGLLGGLFGGLLAGCASGGGAGARKDGAAAAVEAPATWTLVVHGGAGTLEPSEDPALAQQYRVSLGRALDVGAEVLRSGGSSMDACEAVVRVLEDDELFNAGRGAALTREGTVELDASIMDGSTLKCGAVAGVTTVRHPVTLARKVMEQTRHILMSGTGAEQFADRTGVERVENAWFITPKRRQMLEELLHPKAPVSRGGGADAGKVAHTETGGNAARMGTVGCVARDSAGRLAAATSTGGLTGKLPGRIGDSPLIGAGNYANSVVAVSCTGTGEQFIRHGVARGVAARMEYARESLEQATNYFIFTALNKEDGGMIAVDAKGNVAMTFSTVGMYRAVADSKGRREVKIWKE